MTTAAPHLGARLRSPVGVSMAGKLAEAITLVALATLVPRALGPADYGSFAVVLAVVQLTAASLAVGGAGMMARFVPAAGEDAAGVARSLALRLTRFRALVLLVVAGAAVALAATGRVSPVIALVVVLAIALDSAATLLSQAGLGLGRTTLWSFRWPIENGVLVVSALVLATLAGSGEAPVAVAVAAAAAALVAALVVAPLLRGAPVGVEVPDGAIQFGLLQGVSGALNLLMHRGAVVAVALMGASRVEAGYAGLAIGVGLAVTYAVAQAFAVQLPALAAQSVDDPGGAEAHARRLARTATLAIVPVSIAAALSLEWTVPLVFGEPFRDAVPAFAAAIALMPLAPVASLSTQGAALRLRPVIRVRAAGLGTAVFALVALAAIPPWGALGATLALLAGALTSMAAESYQLRDLISRSLFLTAASGSLSCLAIGLWVA